MPNNQDNNPIWSTIRDLFPDNSLGDISPADMRDFVDAVTTEKNGTISTYTNMTDVYADTAIYADDYFIVLDDLDPNLNGLFAADINNPVTPGDMRQIFKVNTNIDNISDLDKPKLNKYEAYVQVLPNSWVVSGLDFKGIRPLLRLYFINEQDNENKDQIIIPKPNILEKVY